MKSPFFITHMLRPASLLSAFVLFGSHAQAIGWNYAELSYLADGKSYYLQDEQAVFMTGLTLDSAFSVHDHVHVRGISRAWTSRIVLPSPGGYVDVAGNEWHSLGVGVSYPLSLADMVLSPWAELSLDAHGLNSIGGAGHGYALGVRSRWRDAYELGIWYRAANTEVNDPFKVRIDPSAYGIDFLYSLSDRLALRLGWSNGDLELKGGMIREKYTVTSTEFGLRYLFDAPVEHRGNREVAPLGYNHVQVAYAVSGNVKVRSQNIDWDLNEGISLAFRASPRANFFFGARYDGRTYDPGVLSLSSIAPANHFAAGPGGYYTVNQGELSYSGYAQLTYNRVAAIEGLVLQGYGATLGVRVAYRSLLEAHVFRIDARAREKVAGDVSRMDPEGIGMELVLAPFDTGLAFILGYEEMKFGGTFFGNPLTAKTDQWLLGLRQQF
jgi:hypothetical protein